MSKQSSGTLEFAAGLIVGGIVGALFGLLFAPQSGEDTRSQLAERGIELRNELQKRAGEVQEKLPDLVGEQRTRVQEAIEKGKDAAARKRKEILSQLEGEESAGAAG